MSKGKRTVRNFSPPPPRASNRRRRGSSEELEFFAGPTGPFAQRLLDSRRSPSSEPDPLAQVQCVWSPIAVFDAPHQPTLATTSFPQAVVGTSHLPFMLPPWERLLLTDKTVYEQNCQQLVTAAEESSPPPDWLHENFHSFLRYLGIYRTASERDALSLFGRHPSLAILTDSFRAVLEASSPLSVLVPYYYKLVHHGKSFLSSYKTVSIDSNRRGVVRSTLHTRGHSHPYVHSVVINVQ